MTLTQIALQGPPDNFQRRSGRQRGQSIELVVLASRPRMTDLRLGPLMTESTEKKVTFKITLTVSDPAAMRAEALRGYLAGGGQEEDFLENERMEDKMEETPIGAWVEALFDHPREFGPGFDEHSYWVDSSEFYQPPPLPKGFDPATSISGAQIARRMTVALESDYWNDLKPVLPEPFKSLVTNPVWFL